MFWAWLVLELASVTPTTFAPPDFEDSLASWIDEKSKSMDTASEESLCRHYHLNHLSFHKICLMVHQGFLDKHFISCCIPCCTCCLYGKATQKAWCTHKAPTPIHTSTRPGEVVFIDQLTVSIPGLVSQMKGFLTREHYHYATVFLDHYNDIPFIVFQKSLSGEETVQSKSTFESFAKQHGVSIHHYHTENGNFTDNLFKVDTKAKGTCPISPTGGFTTSQYSPSAAIAW